MNRIPSRHALYLIRWGGSIIDSIVGTYLTQNVSDVLSSSAFMNLAARFPSGKYAQGLRMLARGCAGAGCKAQLGVCAAASAQERQGERGEEGQHLESSRGKEAGLSRGAGELTAVTCAQQDCSGVVGCGCNQVEQDCLYWGGEEDGERWPAVCGLPVGVDMVDWEAVRTAEPSQVSESIRCRGMQFMLTQRIQKVRW